MLQPGEVIDVTEVREREDGRVRVRFSGGWVSAVAPNGDTRLQEQQAGKEEVGESESQPIPLPAQSGSDLLAPIQTPKE